MEYGVDDFQIWWMRGYQRKVLNDRVEPIFDELNSARENERRVIAERLITELTS